MANKPLIEAYIEDNYPYDMENQNSIEKLQIDAIPWTKWFETWLIKSIESLPKADTYELSLRLASDREIAALNSKYRQKSQPTDVLAFAALESTLITPLELTQSLYLGDIIISLDTAYQQAQEQNHSLTTEVAWLASHGFLHLLGWDHPNDDSLNKMLQKQAKLLKSVQIVSKVSV